MSLVRGANLDVAVMERTMLQAAEAANMGVMLTFIDGARLENVYVSQAASRMIGWSVEHLLKSDPFSWLSPRDVARVRERWELRKSGQPGTSTYEISATRQDGSEAQLEITTTRTTVEGRPALFAFLVDVSARKEAEQLRLRQEARFRELLDAAPEMIAIIRDGRFLYANRVYVATLGYDAAEELYAIPIADLVEPEDAEVQRARQLALLAVGSRTSPHVYRARRKDGTRLQLEASSVYFEYEGKPAALATARDVTQRKELELQLLQFDRLAALGTMAAGVAHEINNPLAYVKLNLEWLARKLPAVPDDPASLPGLLAMLQEAQQGVERASLIVRELRSFSRADSETRAPVDLATVVESAIRMVGNEIRHKATVTTSYQPAAPALANEARLEQVMVNLLLNAAQAMTEGQTGNEVRVTVRAEGDRHSVIEVWDNGAGIAPEVLSRIFDPFFTTRPVGVGTGLGLSICHGIVTSLGGRIAAHSAPGEGTTFRVLLPITETVAADSGGPPSAGPASRDVARARVLVVDDEQAIGQTLSELLGSEHTVVTATNAYEALARLVAEDFDVIFCDLIMPGTSGMDLFGQVRSLRPGLERRFVFMSGGAFTPRAADFLSSVENRRIEKPFSIGLVEQLVREMAPKRRRAEPAAGVGDP